MEKLHSLQTLRGLAALLVLIAHVVIVKSGVNPPIETKVLGSGAAIGVDLFFVISGFVVALSANRSKSPAAFLADRAYRVLPLYFLASIAALALFGIESYQQIWNSFVFVPFFDSGVYTNPAHRFGWSISLEMLLYFGMALALVTGRRWPLVFGALIVSLVGWGGVTSESDIVSHFVGTPLLLEFLFGVIIARSVRPEGVGVSLVLASIGACLMIYNMHSRGFLGVHGPVLAMFEFGLMRAIFWGLPCALLVAGLIGMERSGVKFPHITSWFGSWSYSFYLVQPFSILLAREFGPETWTQCFLVFLTLNFALGLVTYHMIELPLMDARRKQRAGRKSASAATCSAELPNTAGGT